jgi:sulfite reductase alpha subunit-like flavoprotein
VCSEIVFSQAGNYETGDYLGVFPENPKRTVDAIIQRCALDPDQYFSLRGFQSAISMRRKTFPNPCSVREFLARFCDLRRPLPKESVKKLQRYADSIDSKRVAAALENRNTFVEEFHHKPFDEILAGFPSIKLGLADLVDILPAVKPLYYSIASSRLVVSVVIGLFCIPFHT